MAIPTLLREAEHKALAKVTLNGSVLDLGGDDRAEYRKLIGGEHVFTTVNMDEKARPDIFHDLEKPLPVADSSYDNAVLMNVLEHIYNYRQLLTETARAVRPGGKVIIVVPFLFPIHPSPNDFWRFTAETLRRECAAAGLMVEELTPLGTGVTAVRYTMLYRLFPLPVRFLGHYLIRPLVYGVDAFYAWLARVSGKKYNPADYALGYAVTARKNG